jgi:uncharacterized membrane protein YeaQ/YmgE (transglycosylase-associated protein family)
LSHGELPGSTDLPRAPDTSRTKPDTSRTKEAVMDIIAWVVLGLAAGLLANVLIPGRRSQGLAITCVIGVGGALGGGWGATRLSHFPTLHGSVNLSTWLTIAGAAVLLPACHLVTGRAGPRMAHQ